ncbi:MAG: arginine--tRNA ligase [Proteobacteria bacterium]|nr:arginine--tRNA ligase [Pseudomonadota bacterium]
MASRFEFYFHDFSAMKVYSHGDFEVCARYLSRNSSTFTNSYEPLMTQKKSANFLPSQISQDVSALLQIGGDEDIKNIAQILSVKVILGILNKPPEHVKKDGYDASDFALPCFILAKKLKTPPPRLAQIIASHLNKTIASSQRQRVWWLATAVAHGAFVNMNVNPTKLCSFVFQCFSSRESIQEMMKTQVAADNKSVMIEYSQPNTHKEFHIGHTRNVCLGASLQNLYLFLGYNTIGVNYIGDEGTHVAKCLWRLSQLPQPLPPPNIKPTKWYNQHYSDAHRMLSETPSEDISSILAELENQQGDYFELWQKTKQDCLEEFQRIYAKLQITFQEEYYESQFTQAAHHLVDHYLKKGIFTISDGAVGRDLSDHDLGFMMVRKSDGNTLYITKDLVLANQKQIDYPEVTLSLVIVGDEQNFHFQQLFTCLDIMGVNKGCVHQHISYGMVVLPEGKMSSRKGNTVSFWDLIAMIESGLQSHFDLLQQEKVAVHDEQPPSTMQPLYALGKNKDMSPQEITEVTNKLTLGTLKFGMLSQDPKKKIIFDPDAFTKFEGRTGPYLMYAYTRAKSILSRAASIHDDGSASSVLEWSEQALPTITHYERELLIKMSEFFDAATKACYQHSPAILCHYLYDLTRAFSRFYTHCPMISLDDQALRKLRVTITHRFAELMALALNLLGIEPPERM